jgi:TRAP-type C4-dicarboxylate transport system permease small subunit
MLNDVYNGASRFFRWCAYAGISLLCVAMLLTVADVLTRRSINVTIAGLVDITQLLVMGCVFLVIPYVFIIEANVGVEFVTDRLPPRALAWVKSAAAACGVLFMALVAWYSGKQALLQIAQGDTSQTIGIPIALYWGPLIAGCALAVAAAALLALRYAIVACGGRDIGTRDVSDGDPAHPGRAES